MNMKRSRWLLVVACAANAIAANVTVRDAAEFRRAATQAVPGTRILLVPGDYAGGFSFSNLGGETNQPIVIAAADSARPPVIKGGATGISSLRCDLRLSPDSPARKAGAEAFDR